MKKLDNTLEINVFETITVSDSHKPKKVFAAYNDEKRFWPDLMLGKIASTMDFSVNFFAIPPTLTTNLIINFRPL